MRSSPHGTERHAAAEVGNRPVADDPATSYAQTEGADTRGAQPRADLFPPEGQSTSDASAAAVVMPEQPPGQLSLIERIERALVLLACFIELDGDVHLPMYEKFEAELEALKRAEATRERARQRLAACKEAEGAS